MASPRSFLIFSTFILLLSTFAAAWPWPRFLPELDSLVVRRQNPGDSPSGSPSPTPTPTPSNSSPNGGSSTKSQSPSGSGTGSASGSSTPTKSTGSQSGSSSSSPTPTEKTVYDPRLPVGGITMTKPAAASGAQYYRIGEQITFGWNYTDLKATPTALNIFASCNLNKALYTLAINQTVGQSGVVTWDTNNYATATAPLVQQTYTLIIYDAASSISAVPQAGYLSVFSGFTFGMYAAQSPLPNESLNGEVKCATCSGAMSIMDNKALSFMFAMSFITVCSFTWFANGAGVIW